MSDKKSGKLIHYLGPAIPLLLVVYVLSYGPVSAIVLNSLLESLDSTNTKNYGMIAKSYDAFYAPLEWGRQKNQFVNAKLGDYRKYCFIKLYPGYNSACNGCWSD